jgi:predicted CopG family antitoxin
VGISVLRRNGNGRIYIGAYTYTYMVKVMSVSDEAYKKLKAIKRDKSFSEIIIEVVDNRNRNKRSIAEFAGAFGDNADEWEKIKRKIYSDRKKTKLREYKW